MTHDERERAEQYVQTLREDFTLLDDPDHKGWLSIRQSELIDALLAIMREERARAYEEAAYYLEYKASGPIPPDAIDHMKDCAKRLREEGGQR